MTSLRKHLPQLCFILAAGLAVQTALAGQLRERLAERRAAHQQESELDAEDSERGDARLPPGVTLVRDVSYGLDKAQRFDVYRPANASNAPVIFMVHGGGWRRGDKAARSVVENKVARWATRGIIVVSANYRMLPGADPLVQASDVGRALAAAQGNAASWGGDRNKFVLMGHSAGAHLVALLASAPQIAEAQGAGKWLGTAALDGATLDVEMTMRQRHFRLHDQAFGTDPAFWKSVSPYAQLLKAGQPLLAVCSTRRDDSCAQADHYVAKAASLGMRAQVLREDLSHKDINQTLGEANAYTQAVEAFLRSLDPALAKAL